MKRIVVIGLVAVWSVFGTGCIAVLGASTTKIGMTKEVVAVDGRVYVIDKEHGTAREIDLSGAAPFDASETSGSDVSD